MTKSSTSFTSRNVQSIRSAFLNVNQVDWFKVQLLNGQKMDIVVKDSGVELTGKLGITRIEIKR